MVVDIRIQGHEVFIKAGNPPRRPYLGRVAFDREQLKPLIADLASRGVYIGTSSWKYPGWRGMLYDDARYIYRGKFAESRFERNCLTEYAEVFKTVCVDAAYYTFPSEKYLEGLAAQVPADYARRKPKEQNGRTSILKPKKFM